MKEELGPYVYEEPDGRWGVYLYGPKPGREGAWWTRFPARDLSEAVDLARTVASRGKP